MAGDCYIVAAGVLEMDELGHSEVGRSQCFCTDLTKPNLPLNLCCQIKEAQDPRENAANVFNFAKDMLACSREASDCA